MKDKGFALLIAKRAAGKKDDDEESPSSSYESGGDPEGLGKDLLMALKDEDPADVLSVVKDIVKACIKEAKEDKEAADEEG